MGDVNELLHASSVSRTHRRSVAQPRVEASPAQLRAVEGCSSRSSKMATPRTQVLLTDLLLTYLCACVRGVALQSVKNVPLLRAAGTPSGL